MDFFWPQYPNPIPDGKARLGRVLHWLALSVGAAIAGVGVMVVADGGAADLGVMAVLVGVGAVVAQLGRGLRYVLADE